MTLARIAPILPALGLVFSSGFLASPDSRAGDGPPQGNSKALKSFRVFNGGSGVPDADDYHITIQALDSAHVLNVDRDNPGPPPDPAIKDGPFTKHAVTGNGTSMITVDWDEGTVKSGTYANLGVRLTQVDNEVEIVESYFTRKDMDGKPGKTKDVAVPGFKVKKDPLYTITNHFDSVMGIRNLVLLFNVAEIPFFSLDPGNLASFGPLTTVSTDFVLAPHSEMTFTVGATDLDPGNFLYVQGEVYDETFSTQYGAFIDGHQSVPEPSVARLGSLIGFLAATYLGRRFRQGKPRHWA